MPDPIHVLVVDDSAFMRKMVTEILSDDPSLLVVGQARDGADALKKLEELRPHVITMDVEMPVMDGFEALSAIMRQRPTPVVMLSSLTQAGADATIRCLESGAIDFVGKPSGSISLDIKKISAELIAKVKIAATARLRSAHHAPVRPHLMEREAPKIVETSPIPRITYPERASGSLSGRSGVLIIGSSTGGPRALQGLVPKLPGDLGVPGIIIQHMPPGFTKSLAQRLNDLSPLTVREAEAGDHLQPNTILVAPGGHHLQFDSHGAVCFSDDPPIHGVRPAVDVTMASIARLYGGRTVGVLLTGMGKDGARGLKTLHDLGAETIAEDESTCIVYGMPKSAVDLGAVSQLLPLHEIAHAVTLAVRTRGFGTNSSQSSRIPVKILG